MLRSTPDNTAGAGLEAASTTTMMNLNNGTHTVASLREQLGLFYQMSLPYFKEETAARWLLTGVIGLTLMNSGVSVAFSYLSRDFWSALNAKDADQFEQVLLKFGGALAAGVPVVVLSSYQRDLLALRWREWMTERMLTLYIGAGEPAVLEASEDGEDTGAGAVTAAAPSGAYYAIESTGAALDNPDQRIAEDVRSFTRASLSFSLTILRSVVDLFSFSAILYSIYPVLFAVIAVYSSVGTLVTVSLGKQLVELNYQALQSEADFRYSLVRVRENAESIAFYGGEGIERDQAKTRLDRMIDTRKDIITVERNLEFFTTAYQFLIQILPGAVVAPLFFSGKVELGVVSQSFGAFNHILNDFSIIVNQFESLSQFSAGVDRLGEFALRLREETGNENDNVPVGADGEEKQQTRGLLDLPAPLTSQAQLQAHARATAALEAVAAASGDENSEAAGAGAVQSMLQAAVDEGSAMVTSLASVASVTGTGGEGVAPLSSQIEMVMSDQVGIMLSKVTVRTPDNRRTLIRDLSLEFGTSKPTAPQRLLVVGESGAGKSSLLRAMAGLWMSGAGVITRPAEGDVLFLPQRPYCTLGSLRDQLVYPRLELSRGAEEGTDALDDELLVILRQVRLGGLAEKWSATGDEAGGLDAVQDWSSILSLGEQQRLAFGRLLFNKPKVVILDEATSALDIDSERAMYENLASVPGLAWISVGHRPSLTAFHDFKLRLRAGGDRHKLTPLEAESVLASAAAPSSASQAP